VHESGRRFEIRNYKKRVIKKVRIDGCVINDARPRCDFLFEVDGRIPCAAYVELKGSDVKKAYSQIEATLTALRPRHGACRVLCYIVASRVPRITPSVQQLIIMMGRRHGAELRVGTTQIVVDVEADLLTD
jgi:hypothetical protein